MKAGYIIIKFKNQIHTASSIEFSSNELHKTIIWNIVCIFQSALVKDPAARSCETGVQSRRHNPALMPCPLQGTFPFIIEHLIYVFCYGPTNGAVTD